MPLVQAFGLPEAKSECSNGQRPIVGRFLWQSMRRFRSAWSGEPCVSNAVEMSCGMSRLAFHWGRQARPEASGRFIGFRLVASVRVQACHLPRWVGNRGGSGGSNGPMAGAREETTQTMQQSWAFHGVIGDCDWRVQCGRSPFLGVAR